mmetsp:Transcript_32445/g.45216  ORF Transcript_32445/g.45216 Transcript_32445/m.45216 type:complete len:313 (+) Transcript_32445:36-974(+)
MGVCCSQRLSVVKALASRKDDEKKSDNKTAISSINTRDKLSSGNMIPRFGLGTWLSKGKGEAYNAVKIALRNGYRLIDTAQLYDNEEDVGRAIKESKIPRNEIYVVTKLRPEKHNDPVGELEISLHKLGLEYVDLYLIHSPSGKQVLDTWNSLIEAKKKGLAKDIGVSNFGVEQLENLKKSSCSEMPAVNQIELHLWNQQKKTVKYLQENNIAVMGYCPLGRLKRIDSATKAKEVATNCSLTVPQVAIRWSVQKGYITIPKSSNENRIKENSNIFGKCCIPKQMMEELEAMDEGFKASNSVNSMDIPWEDIK